MLSMRGFCWYRERYLSQVFHQPRSLLVLHVRPQSAVWHSQSRSSLLTSHLSPLSPQLSLAMSLLKCWSLVVPAALRRIHSPAPTLPHNIQELSSSQTRELASAQAARVFGSGFLSHQGNIMDLAGDQNTLNMPDNVPPMERDRMEFFQQNKLCMEMKTNLPEPYQPLGGEGSQLDLKEGLPVGLSDSQVVGGLGCLFLFIFSNLGESWGKIQHGLQIRNSLTKLVNWRQIYI